LAIFGCKRVNCDEMDGDRLRLPANRNCYRLSRVSWALLKLLVVHLKHTNAMHLLIGYYATFHRPAGFDSIRAIVVDRVYIGLMVALDSLYTLKPPHSRRVLNRSN